MTKLHGIQNKEHQLPIRDLHPVHLVREISNPMELVVEVHRIVLSIPSIAHKTN